MRIERRTPSLAPKEPPRLEEAERLYARAKVERTAAAVNDAIEHHKELIALLEPTDLETAFEFVRRIHQMRHWTAEY